MELLNEKLILRRIDDHGHIGGVFGGGTDHCWSTDVDLFDCLLACDAFAADRCRKRIKIYDHHVDRLDAVFAHRRDMFSVVAQSKQSAVNPRMQSFYAAIHHFRKAGNVRNVAYLDAGVAQSFGGAAGADDLYVELFELTGEVDN